MKHNLILSDSLSNRTALAPVRWENARYTEGESKIGVKAQHNSLLYQQTQFMV